MPRPIVLGNGEILLCLDESYAIRDLFYPYVGLYNHLNGRLIRTGAWTEGHLSWLHQPEWKRAFNYFSDTLVSRCIFSHKEMSLRIEFMDAVDPEQPIFYRHYKIFNLSKKARDVQLFFSHDLCIGESDIGDTAFYFPHVDAMVHYKGHHYFAFGGHMAQTGIHEYAAGIKGFDHLEGTWKDAEDGRLSMNPIAQGSVDSTFSLRGRLEGKEHTEGTYWIMCARDLDQLIHLHKKVEDDIRSNTIIQKTKKHWNGWLSSKLKNFSELNALSKESLELLKRSLLIIRTQIDSKGGILAANDSDILETNKATYSYVWPRDGALIANVLTKLGYTDLSHQFLRFCRSLLRKEHPILLQKYRPDGTFGASWLPWIVEERQVIPFQEDETALTVHALGELYKKTKDKALLEEFFESYVVPTCDFMNVYRHPKTFLPLPSWYLWEERRGIHVFTTCSVILAMQAAAELAKELEHEKEHVYTNAAKELIQGIHHYFYDKKSGVFCRQLTPKPNDRLILDRTPDASLLWLVLSGVLSIDDERFLTTYQWLKKKLFVQTPVQGYARYEGDYYFRTSQKYPGNPWIICTLWFAQVEMKMANSIEELEKTLVWLEWTQKIAAPTGVLPEQVHPETGKPLSVSPLTWSHSEFIKTILTYLERHDALR